MSRPQNQKGKKFMHQLTDIFTEWKLGKLPICKKK